MYIKHALRHLEWQSLSSAPFPRLFSLRVSSLFCLGCDETRNGANEPPCVFLAPRSADPFSLLDLICIRSNSPARSIRATPSSRIYTSNITHAGENANMKKRKQ